MTNPTDSTPGRHEPDLGHHPNLNKPPLRTGNPGDMHAARENAAFSPPFWAVDRMSAGVLMLILIACILAVGWAIIGAIW